MAASILNIILALWDLVDMIFSSPDLQQINSALEQLNNPQIEQFAQKMLHLMYGPLGIVNILDRAGGIGFDPGWCKKNEVVAKLPIFIGRRRPLNGAVSDAMHRLFPWPGIWHLGIGGFKKTGCEIPFQLNADACSVRTFIELRSCVGVRPAKSCHAWNRFAQGAADVCRHLPVDARDCQLFFGLRVGRRMVLPDFSGANR